MRPVSERLNSLTDGAYLLFCGMRLHDDQHDPTSNPRVYQNAGVARAPSGLREDRLEHGTQPAHASKLAERAPPGLQRDN
jgi:hypothetical protein